MATLYSSQAIADSSESASGKIRVSTNSEALTGTNDTTAMTPAKVAAYVASATGTVTGNLRYKGAYDASANSPTLTSSKKGDFYIVSVAGSALASVALNVGDHIVFNQDAASPITSAMFDTIDNTETPASTTTAGVIEIATNAEATAGSATDKALVPSNVASLSIANTQVTGLGTASTASTGTSAGNVVVLDGSARLPAVDASQLTNLPSASAASTSSAGIIEIATNAEATAGSATDKALVPSNVASLSIANTQVTGLGTASTASTGTSAGNVVVLDGSARLPAVDASQLTNLPSASAASTSSAGIIEIATNAEATAGSATDKALVPSNVASLSIANTQVTGLGTASTASTGTSAGNVVVLDGSARLPAVDGSQLTNLPSGSAASTTSAGVIEIATNTEAGAGSATDKALVPSNVASLSIANTQVTGLGTASTASTGTSAGNVVVLDGSARLPAVDGSQLTNLPSGSAASTSAAGIIEIATNTEAGAGSATDKALVPSNVASLSIANTQVTGLGTASTASTGTSAGNVVVLDGSAKLPAVDGSQLTNLPSGSAASTTSAGVIEIATNTEAGAGSATDKALVPSNVASLSIANTQVTGLGTASTASTGTSAGNVVVLDGSAKLPAIDGSQLTNLPSGGFTYSAITANTTAQASYHYSCGAGNQSFTLTLPAVSGVSAGKEIRVKNMGTGTITIDSNGSEEIDGSTNNYTLDVQYSAITLVSTGSAWEII